MLPLVEGTDEKTEMMNRQPCGTAALDQTGSGHV